ncbi:MAG: hypothetical protein M1817_002498 [Caeruleum heppii]|nr:MAG: hypothetical protein M1817_002498 [Caeruleum heppii]
MQHRRDEILAKKAKLEELKRQRKLRQDQISRPIEDGSPMHAPTPGRAVNREELDTFITTLVGESSRPSSAASKEPAAGIGGTARKASRPSSVLSGADLSLGDSEVTSPGRHASPGLQHPGKSQTLSATPLFTLYNYAPAPSKEVLSYSKAVQTSESWSPRRSRKDSLGVSEDGDEGSPRTPRKRLSRREREKEEELRENIRREIEEELKTLSVGDAGDTNHTSTLASTANFPARTLTDEELNAVTSSNDFLDFVERSSKVIERALDQEYDVLADYALRSNAAVDDDDDDFGGRGKARRRVKEVAQFWDERWCKKRMISSLDFSPKFPELALASYTKNPSAPHDPDGLVQVWNAHLHSRAEYVFHAQSDVLVAKFSPFHPNLIVGGAYSGQVLLWDTRAKAYPVQKTPLTGAGHTHPVYAIDMVGTQNANNILSCSTDGVVCGWTVDMLSHPQEYLELTTPPPFGTKTEDLAPTCMAFPQSDPTFFLVGTEEGGVYACQRYERAGAKAGVDARISYRGHAAPVMSVDFHPSRGPVDLGDLVLSSSLDWSVKLWKVRGATASGTSASGPSNLSTTGGVTSTSSSTTSSASTTTRPLLDIPREDLIYDARWSPTRPSIFALVDGAGTLEIWDLNTDTEVPAAKINPGRHAGVTALYGARGARGLNKVAWEKAEGKRLGTGGLDGVVTLFEVGADLGGTEGVRAEEWAAVMRLGQRLGG